MNSPIRLLHLDDSPLDAELVSESLAAGDVTYEITVVRGRERFESVVIEQDFDLILSDYNVPGYDGMSAIRFVCKTRPDTPLIILSGFVGDESAVACLKAGATDFVLKQNLSRLSLAIPRALAEADEHRRRKTAELSMRRAFSMLGAIRDSVFVFMHETFEFNYVNRGAIEQTGYTREELLGMRPFDLIPDIDEARFRECCSMILTRTDHTICFETMHRRKDGTEFPVEIVLQFITPDGESGQFVATARDIADRREKELHLRARELAESSSRAKSEFLASMSHELRTPLNGILGMNELLMNTCLTDQQRQFVDACTTSGKALLQQINNILDLSKIEAGKFELDLQELDLETLLFDIIDVFTFTAQKKCLSLHCHLHPSACIKVLCDGNRLRQILVNLIGNAVKFTTVGDVTVSAECEQQNDDRLLVRFCVRDTGIGIPADRSDRLFAPFSQVDASTARTYGGSGLGLSICRQLAELMGGRIGVESQFGIGSNFCFEFPAPAGAEHLVARRRNLLSGRRMLIVEGTNCRKYHVGDHLLDWGCDLVRVSTFCGAFDSIARADAADMPFGAILIDCILIGAGNFDALQDLSKKTGVPVIGFGTPQQDVTAVSLLRSGLIDMVRSPVRPSALFAALQAAIVPKSTETTCSVGTAPSDQRAIKLAGRILVAEDSPINQTFVSMVISDCGCICDIANNGEDVITALETNHYDLVLMDCQMPTMDGFTATREIRRRETLGELPGRIPIVALTANAFMGDRERCLEAGMDDYLSKPLNARQLHSMLKKHLQPELRNHPLPARCTLMESPCGTD